MRKRWETILVFAGLGGPVGGAVLYAIQLVWLRRVDPSVANALEAVSGLAAFVLFGFLFGLLPAVPTGIAYISLPRLLRHPLMAGVLGAAGSLLLLVPFIQIPDAIRLMAPAVIVSGFIAAVVCALVDTSLAQRRVELG